jgi:hypothetical protein
MMIVPYKQSRTPTLMGALQSTTVAFTIYVSIEGVNHGGVL